MRKWLKVVFVGRKIRCYICLVSFYIGREDIEMWPINNVCNQKCISWFLFVKLALMQGMKHKQSFVTMKLPGLTAYKLFVALSIVYSPEIVIFSGCYISLTKRV